LENQLDWYSKINLLLISIVSSGLFIKFQLLFGDLFLPILALRIIEDNSASDFDLQTNFDLVDECGGKSVVVLFEENNNLA
jgi:hypothetical protein